MKKTYIVNASKEGNPSVQIQAGEHTVIVDEPIEVGGTDLGMNPIQLFLSSLASCLTLVISIYAEAMGVKIDKIELKIEGDLDSDGMFGVPKIRPGLLKIRKYIKIETSEDEESIQQILELAGIRCPVADSISKGVEIENTETSIITK